MHHIYHTEGVILGSKNSGEAGKYFSIFTRDLGMIYASAQGIRKVTSKLRFVLQDYSYVKIDLVQGRDFWRLTSSSKTNILDQVSKNRETLPVLCNVASLLKRLLTGVEPNEALFSDLIKGLLILEKVETKEDLKNIEAVIILRILNNLGYIGGDEALQSLIKPPFEMELLQEVSKCRAEVLRQINKALKETHL